MRRRSVEPPIPRDVSVDRAVPGRSSISSFASSERMCASVMCMVCRVFGPEKNHQLVAGAADSACSDGEDGIAAPRVFQKEADAVLYGADVVNVFVSGFADRGREGFARDTGDGQLAGGVNVGKH